MGTRTVREREGATDDELRKSRTDVLTGMFFSNLVMYFIILTTAATLHAHGQTSIEYGAAGGRGPQAACRQRRLPAFYPGIDRHGHAGRTRTGGRGAYAVAEARVWRGTLEDKPRLAKKFYAIVAVSMLLGLSLNYAGIHAVKMLFLAAVSNGVLAPPLIVLVVLLTSNKKVMGKRVNPPRSSGWAGPRRRSCRRQR